MIKQKFRSLKPVVAISPKPVAINVLLNEVAQMSRFVTDRPTLRNHCLSDCRNLLQELDTLKAILHATNNHCYIRYRSILLKYVQVLYAIFDTNH